MKRKANTDQIQMFGGDWTQEKLAMLRKYLNAYTKALKNTPFQLIYIDAFAGTGYLELKNEEEDEGLFFPSLAEAESEGFFDGSAKIALQTQPPFHRYFFIERSRRRFQELQKLASEFGAEKGRISVAQEDCNVFLPELCRGIDWQSNRAVLFLDPFGMEVEWKTMEAIAATKAIDVWILFPLGIGVNRLLTKNRDKMPAAWRRRLDKFLGTDDWYEDFYQERRSLNLFGQEECQVEKVCNCRAIANFYIKRLKTIFPAVADNPRFIENSKGSPMFLFCFAAGNPAKKAVDLALRIAQNILEG
jgi:three-Cys-motif partner protein